MIRYTVEASPSHKTHHSFAAGPLTAGDPVALFVAAPDDDGDGEETDAVDAEDSLSFTEKRSKSASASCDSGTTMTGVQDAACLALPVSRITS